MICVVGIVFLRKSDSESLFAQGSNQSPFAVKILSLRIFCKVTYIILNIFYHKNRQCVLANVFYLPSLANLFFLLFVFRAMEVVRSFGGRRPSEFFFSGALTMGALPVEARKRVRQAHA
jgi:hypothetical protein